MARSLNGAELLAVASTPLTAVPLSMSCLFRPVDATSNGTLMAVQDTALDNDGFRLRKTSAAKIAAITQVTGNNTATSAGSYTGGVWNHAGAAFAAINDRIAYVNGGGSGSNASSATPSGLDTLVIGARKGSTTGDFYAGDICEAGWWNVALTPAEWAILGLGYSPLLVRPQNLFAYVPIFGRSSPEIDIRGGRQFVLTGTAQAPHARIFLPAHLALGKRGLPPATQKSRAMRVVSNSGGFTREDGTTNNLEAGINEAVPDDDTYIQSPANPATPKIIRWKVDPANPPSAGNQVFKTRYKEDSVGSGTLNLKSRMYQGGGNVEGAGTLVIERTFLNVATGIVEDDYNLSGGEIALITNRGEVYRELEVWMT